jgi:cysteine synthase A
MRLTGALTGYEPGPSTGTNLVGAFRLLEEMHRKGEQGAIVTIICDDGKRYHDSYYDAQWLKSKELNQDRWRSALETFWNSGQWNEPG